MTEGRAKRMIFSRRMKNLEKQLQVRKQYSAERRHHKQDKPYFRTAKNIIAIIITTTKPPKLLALKMSVLRVTLMRQMNFTAFSVVISSADAIQHWTPATQRGQTGKSTEETKLSTKSVVVLPEHNLTVLILKTALISSFVFICHLHEEHDLSKMMFSRCNLFFFWKMCTKRIMKNTSKKHF